jgi:hypothetical protein
MQPTTLVKHSATILLAASLTALLSIQNTMDRASTDQNDTAEDDEEKRWLPGNRRRW